MELLFRNCEEGRQVYILFFFYELVFKPFLLLEPKQTSTLTNQSTFLGQKDRNGKGQRQKYSGSGENFE